MPVEVAIVLDPRARHQAFRVLLRDWAEELTRSVSPNSNESEALQNMAETLHDRQYVLDEVAMLVVTKFEEMVSVHIINGVTSMGALSVTSFEGEQRNTYLRMLLVWAAWCPLYEAREGSRCVCAGVVGAPAIWLFASGDHFQLVIPEEEMVLMRPPPDPADARP